jgi:hypothetical protein
MTVVFYLGSGFIRPSRERVVTPPLGVKLLSGQDFGIVKGRRVPLDNVLVAVVILQYCYKLAFTYITN